MSGDRPLCLECKGKFGASVWGKVCELCSLQRQIYSHLVSPRFPAEEKEFATRAVRECYHRILEHSDAVWELKRVEGEKQGPFPGGEEKKEEHKRGEKEKVSPDLIAVKEEVQEDIVDKRPLEAPAIETPKETVASTSPTGPPGLTGKAAPVKPPSSSLHRELEDTPRKRHRAESDSKARGQDREKEKRKKAKRKSRSPKSRSGSRRRRRRRHSREEPEPPRSGSSEKEIEERARVKPSRVPPSSARGSRVPRSPSGPPPGRDFSGYYQAPVWEGPIPANGDQSRIRGSSPKRVNKGVKKRLQQERARDRGWQFRDGKRWR